MRLTCRFVGWLYSASMVLAQPLLRHKLKRRGRQEPGYLQAIEERFGHYSASLADVVGPTIWLHAVSLGETRAAAPLIAAMRARWPGLRLLLTHGTATGRAEGEKLLKPGDLQTWQPWDTPAATQRFLQHFKPDLGVLMETEIWPNLVAACQQTGTPLVLANARMSDKSMRKAQRLSCLSEPAFAALSAVLAQTQDDAERLQKLGARPEVTQVLGNLKFDAQPDGVLLAKGRQWRAGSAKPVVLFASSREGEEQAWAQAVLASKSAQQLQWLIVPRHPQRFDEVAELLSQQGLQVQRRSSWTEQGPPDAGGDVVWLGDSLGEMPLYYGLADVCLLGGSFEPLGGQNLIEAAACACPIIMGPHTFNFAQAAEQALEAGSGWRVADLPEGVRQALDLHLDHDGLQAARRAALDFAQQHRGAVERTVNALNHLQQQGR
jgi:3-deoxy-D-manno-octulosonic-acid transferase